jgi:ABC-type dipeptide/oligopeptide/nickel transport system permease subunit
MAIWPGLAIFLTVLSFNLVGDVLRASGEVGSA